MWLDYNERKVIQNCTCSVDACVSSKMHMSCVKSDFLDSVASQVQSVVATKVIELQYSAFLKSLDLSSALPIMCDY